MIFLTKEYFRVFSFHTKTYNRYYGSNINQFFPKYREWLIRVRNSFFHKYDNSYNVQIERSLSDLNNNIESRLIRSKIFINYLSN